MAEWETLKLANKIRWAPREPGPGMRRARVRQPPSRMAGAVLMAALSIGGARLAWAQSSASSEYQVKAAFLFHFAQFVDWPPESFQGAGSPLTYCTVGGDPFRGALDSSLSGKTIEGRPVRVMHFKEATEIRGCQILFVGAADKKFVSGTLTSLNRSPVLTVGESAQFAQEGGMIGFLLEDNKVRFDINLEAAEGAKLKISARLLALARTVIGGPKGT
jgi:hypothetical protein